MPYRNDDPLAIDAMEKDRLGNYGDFDDNEYPICPICGSKGPDEFYINDDNECVGCSDCIRKADYPNGRR